MRLSLCLSLTLVSLSDTLIFTGVCVYIYIKYAYMITHALDPHTHSCQSRCKRVHVYETEEMYRAGRAFGHISDIPAPAQRGRLDLRSTFYRPYRRPDQSSAALLYPNSLLCCIDKPVNLFFCIDFSLVLFLYLYEWLHLPFIFSTDSFSPAFPLSFFSICLSSCL